MLASSTPKGVHFVLDSEHNTVRSNLVGKTLSADVLSKQLECSNSLQDHEKEEKEKERVQLSQSRADSNWSSLLTQNAELVESHAKSSLPPPYIHPLVKKSSNSLSGKSLEMCTESLGFETGSDRSSSSSPSESEYTIRDEGEAGEMCFEKYRGGTGKKSYSRDQSFPPPIPSLCYYQQPGPSLRMNSQRNGGRFVLNAVSTYTPSNFHVQRGESRLVLAFSDREIGKEKAEVAEEVDEEDSRESGNENEEEIESDDEVEDQKQIEAEAPSGPIKLERPFSG